jgi:hypothetical protein
VPFHVQIRQGLQRASSFNLPEAGLKAIADAWLAERIFNFGGRQWDPRTASLTVLEGPELEEADLSFGQGWNHAERVGSDVTAAVLGRAGRAGAAGAVTVLADSDETRRAVEEVLTSIGAAGLDWNVLRAEILAAAATGGSAARPDSCVVLATAGSEVSTAWSFDAGLALGALAGRTVAVQLGGAAPPPELAELAVLRLDPREPASRQALLERLRHAGCVVGGRR